MPPGFCDTARVLIGYLLAVLGATGSGTGSVLESTAVRRSGAFGGSHDDLAKVARHPLYWTGVVIDIGGFLCAAFALRHLPLFLVQSVLACSVAVTAVISAAIGVRMARTGWFALVVAAAGLVLVGVSAAPGRAHNLPAGWRWILLAIALVVAAIGRYGDRVRPPALGVVTLAFGAGLGFAVVAVSARTVPAPNSIVELLGEPAVWAIVANGVVATAVFARALQLGSATAVSAVMFTTNTVLPSAIGLGLLGDRPRPGMVGVGAVGFLLAVAGAIAVAHFSAAADEGRGFPVPGPVLAPSPQPWAADTL
jgi:drug/metabolite transporter (DMT)-like permease